VSARSLRDRLGRLEQAHRERLQLAAGDQARDRLLEKLDGIRQRLGIVPQELPPAQGAALVAAFRPMLRAYLDRVMGVRDVPAAELAELRAKVEALLVPQTDATTTTGVVAA